MRVNIDCKNMFYFQFIMSQKWFTEKEEKKSILYIKPYRNIMMGPCTQYAEMILNKTAKAINETFTGLKLMLQGFRI